MSAVDIMYTCKGCGWTFSLQRSDACPMCKDDPEIDQQFVFEVLQEYCRRQGFYSSKNKVKTIVKDFKKKTKRLPNFKECWDLSKVVLKKEQAVPDAISKAKRKEDIQAEKERRRREKELKKKRDDAAVGELKCSDCGKVNPSESKFCLECGTQL